MNCTKNGWPIASLDELIERQVIQLTRGKVISKKDMAECPGRFPVYSSAKENDGKFGEYGRHMFDEEMITWSVDGGGRLFHRPKHRFSVTNVGGVLRILDRAKLDYRYLYYILSLRHSEIRFDWVKKAHPSVIRKIYKDIPIPPLAAQRRIVGILDEAFASIAAARANSERNLQHARDLFVAHQKGAFDRLEAPQVEIGEFGIVFDGPHATPKTIDAGPIFLGISTLRDGRLVMGETRHVTPEDFKKWTRRVVPREGDVVFSYETQLGQAALIPKNLKCCLGRRMALVRVNPEKVDPRYFVYYFVSPQFRQFLSDHAIRGATVDRISLRDFPTYKVPLPSRVEQERVADQLDELRQQTDSIEVLYRRKVEALSSLKNSLLHHAFTGHL